MSNTSNSTTYQSGLARLREVDAEAGDKVIASLAGIAPDLGRYIIEFGFGEIYRRPGLSVSQRELATVAMLAALGTATPQLKVHLTAALNVGLTQEELIEVLIQTALYAGFPAALNAIFAAREVFDSYQPPAPPLAPVPVARAFVASMQAGTPAFDLLADEVIWQVPGDAAQVPWAGARHGRDGVASFFAQIAAAGEALHFSPQRWYEGEDEALLRGRIGYRYRNGHVYEGDFVMRFVVVDGLIRQYKIFDDSHGIAQALQA
ncbi:carboxymuconolactone decarboxylase family protein [Andreprevotia chitinilytica]|uniref:carboxymuconolactone decarboxylase family protein n=1 Tax=Andreprevotia chitinilytica TaxID=396808 RepID=UPI000A071E46|nr:carboxymuconolactone decarboxylase family protein [Andreprevotia chitinilytica]